VWWLIHRPVDPLPQKDSGKRTGAFSIVGEKYNLSGPRIKQIYDVMKKQIDLESCEPPMTPAESRKVEVDMQLVFAQLTEALKKRVRNQ
jgi:hypothetical protein